MSDYSCQHCVRAFESLGGLTMHMNMLHPVEAVAYNASNNVSLPLDLEDREEGIGFSAKQKKAIFWYAAEKNLRTSLSAYPMVIFVKDGGKELNVDIDDVVARYDEYKKDEARDKRLAARAKTRKY